MKKIAIAVLLSAFAAAPAVAAPAVAAASPFYVGAQLGDSYIGGFAGYQIDKMYSVEASYIKFDSVSSFGISTTASSIGVAGVAMFPLTLKGAPPFSLFAKAGIERTSSKVKTAAFGPFPASSTTVTDTGLVLGGGAQYDFNKNFSARLGLDIEGRADSLYVSALYKF